MKTLNARILSALQTDCSIRPDELITVGVSGGIDSVFLLTMRYGLKLPLIAAVFNHGLRPEADEECAFVQAYCAEKGIPCVSGKGDVRSFAAEKGIGIRNNS